MAEGAFEVRPVLPPGTQVEDPTSLLEHLRTAGRAVLRSRSSAELVERLGRVGERFLDRDDPLRSAAEAGVAADAGMSTEMARAVVEGMARDWTRERLDLLVRADFPDPTVLDEARPGAGGDAWMAIGDPLAFHLASGSVPGVGATSLLRSLLVKTPTLLKPGRGDRVLPHLLARGIAETDPELAEAIAVVYWPGGSGSEIENQALAAARRVVVYGADETISSLRERLDPSVPLVAYSHRVSIGLIGRDELDARGPELARSAARAVALFDQRGCVSPHVLWVEEGGSTSPEQWAEAVARESDVVARDLPPGHLEGAEASRIQQFRGGAELRGELPPGGGDGRRSRLWKGAALSWTVVLEPDPGFAPSCGGRTIRIKPVRSLNEVAGILAHYHGVLQSAALEVSEGRRSELVRELAEAGVTRLTTLERQPWPPAWWRHDGKGPLEVLVRWISVES